MPGTGFTLRHILLPRYQQLLQHQQQWHRVRSSGGSRNISDSHCSGGSAHPAGADDGVGGVDGAADVAVDVIVAHNWRMGGTEQGEVRQEHVRQG